MMKEKYVAPELEIIEFEPEDSDWMEILPACEEYWPGTLLRGEQPEGKDPADRTET